MEYISSEEIEAIVKAFENKTLSKNEWTHKVHLTVGMYSLFHHSFYEALCLIKSRIITYNEAVGTINNGSSGYHETLTIFWLTILQGFMGAHPHKNLHCICNDFFTSPWASRELPLKVYSREALFSTKARATWVEPDVVSMDQVSLFNATTTNHL